MTTTKLTLYAEPLWDSPYVFSVYVALREKQLPFDSQLVELDAGAQRATAYAALSLTERVPTLVHDGFALSESAAIVDYLEETFSPPTYAATLPENPRDRARARQVMQFLRSDLGALRAERPSDTIFFSPRTTPLSAAAQASADKLLRFAQALIPKQGGPLFSKFCIADADLALALHRLIANHDALPAALLDYATTIWQRPSIQSFVALARPRSPAH